MSNLLSVVIISKNEETYIGDAIKSADFADEVLLLDSCSSDNTCEVAKKLGARVEHHHWLGFGPQKNLAVNLAKNDWVFVLDSDESLELIDLTLLSTENTSVDQEICPKLLGFISLELEST